VLITLLYKVFREGDRFRDTFVSNNTASRRTLDGVVVHVSPGFTLNGIVVYVSPGFI